MTIDLARIYADRGWPVFPTRHAETSDPITGELFKEKTPLTSNGLKGATKTARIIERLWGQHPEAMVGIPTGAPIGAWVLDIDPKHGGYDTLDALTVENGDLPATLAATTPSGGMHYYFKHKAGVRNRGALGEGIDVRGDGGYVVAPGSRLADGRGYDWTDDTLPIMEAPAWLLDLVIKRDPPAAAAGPVTPPLANVPEAYVARAVDSELDAVASAPMGNRNNTLNDAAFSLGTLVGAGALSEAYAREMLQATARQWGRDWAQCCKTIENGLAAGKRQPRTIPPPRDETDNTRLVDVQRMIANGLAKGAAPAEPAAAADAEPQAERAIHATAYVWRDPSTLPRREFVYGKHYIRRYVSVTSAPGGLGKTSLSVAEALAMCSGVPLLDHVVPAPLNVWLFNAEDPRDELERRIGAAIKHYKIAPSKIEGRLHLDTGREQELVVMVDDRKAGITICRPVVEAVVAEIKRHAIDVMIIDPFVSTHGVNENDNGAIDKVAKLWAAIADETGCAIDVVHHVKKTGDREATVEDSRGAGALLAAARSARILNRMTPDQAREAGLHTGDRFGYFSIGTGKSNLSPMDGSLDWCHLVSVPLGNGSGQGQGLKPQDHAPVVTKWSMPTADDIVGELSQAQRTAICVALDNGLGRQSPQSKEWAGRLVAYALSLDIDDKSVVARVKKLLAALEAEGTLVQVDLQDPVRKEAKKFLKTAGWVAP